jgi:DNA-binding GntR family transcriptional regulator
MADLNSLIEQVFAGIKREICSGTLLPGQRVNVTAMSERHRCSKTTLRAALYRLVGEGLLEVHRNEGFYRPLVTDETVRDKYVWNKSIFMMGLNASNLKPTATHPQPAFEPSADPVGDIERFFTLVVEQTDNSVIVREMQRLNDHLHPLRMLKGGLPLDLEGELTEFAKAWAAGDVGALKQLIQDYTQRRLDIVPQIVSMAYRPSSSSKTASRS